tara:strand:- start:469 stop:639 length:171 start_codon:yes stop_codon:yes gene_type:complete
MATYPEVRGVSIRKVGSVPSPLVKGDMFYRTDTKKYYYVADISGTLTAKEIDVTGV